jgi:hypothetical protein
MRYFRFPRSAIFLMLVILAGTMVAIDQGRNIAETYPANLHFETDWAGLLGFFLFLALVLFMIAAVGYGILYALHQSGAQRFPNLRTPDQRR